MMEIYNYLILLLVLIIASNFDILNDMTVPIPLGVFGMVIRTALIIFADRNNAKECMLFAVILGVIFFIGAITGAYGGADIFYASMTGLYLGISGVFAVMIGSLISLPYAVYIKKTKENKTFPYIPFLFIGTLIMFGVYMIKGMFEI